MLCNWAHQGGSDFVVRGARHHRPCRLSPLGWAACLCMHHPRWLASSVGYEAPDICLREGGRVCARGGFLGGQHLPPALRRGVMWGIHRDDTHDTMVNTVDGRWQPAWRGCKCSSGSADHYARSYRLCVGAEGQVPMVFPPMEGLRNSHRPIKPHKAVREVTVAPHMQDGRRIRGTGPLWGLRRPVGGQDCV